MDGFGAPYAATTTRKQGGTPTAYLTNLICRGLFSGPLSPMSPDEVLREIGGIQGLQGKVYRLKADWPLVGTTPYSQSNRPAGDSTDPFGLEPVKAKDQITVNGSTYSVQGAQCIPPDGMTGGQIVIYVIVPS